MRIVSRNSLTARPWKNGGGETREIACWPPGSGLDGFDWRLSTATVATAGPFSAFPGIDRRLYLLTGDGLDLAIDGRPQLRLRAGDHVDFAGEAAVAGAPVGGPVTDLNIMVRRSTARAHITEMAVIGTGVIDPPHPLAAAFIMRGEISLARDPARTATAFDTILPDPGDSGPLVITGDASLLVISFST